MLEDRVIGATGEATTTEQRSEVIKNLACGLMSVQLMDPYNSPYNIKMPDCVYNLDITAFDDEDIIVNGCRVGKDPNMANIIQKGIKNALDNQWDTLSSFIKIEGEAA